MEQQINEAGLPMNFSWRAGIGQNGQGMPQQNIPNYQQPVNGFTPFDNGFKPYQSYRIPQGLSPQELATMNKRGDLEFKQSLLAEIDTNVNDICNDLLNDVYKGNLRELIKQRLRNYFVSVVNKYKSSISGDFFELLYNTCLTAYTNQWVMVCGTAGASSISETEYLYVGGRLYLNPFMIYATMAEVYKGCDYNVNEMILG